MGKAEENKKQKKETLLNSAFDLFISQGIHETTISNIVEHAGVAKGTFYLYFKDKYDIRNKLIAHKARQIFSLADEALHQSDISSLEDSILFIVDHIIEQFKKNKTLLNFISKNLSWGIFKNELINDTSDIDISNIFQTVFKESAKKYENPEVLVYMIIEMTGSTCYSPILYNSPLPIDELKPYLYNSIRQIIRSQEITEDTGHIH